MRQKHDVRPFSSAGERRSLLFTARCTVLAVAVSACGSSGSETVTGPDTKIDPAKTVVTVALPLLLPGDTVTVTLQARNAEGQAITAGGATVVFSVQGGSSTGTFTPVLDHHDGTYSASFIAGSVGTSLTIISQINGAPVTSAQPTVRVVGFTRIAAAGATVVGAQTTTGGFTCGIITTGDMYCWGVAWQGVRGNGTSTGVVPGLVPTVVAGGHQWTEVAAGDWYVCALATGGVVYCWGGNDLSELGQGAPSGMDVTLPTPVSGDSTFSAVSIGQNEGTCAIALGHAAMCWGSGTWGRLGNGSDTLVGVPVAVLGGHLFDALSTSFSGTCGVTGGSAYCWGIGTILGLDTASAPDTCSGTTPCAKEPVAVSGRLTFRPVIALDGNVTCAIATDNQTYCWGQGYLGNGTTTGAPSPTLVSGNLSFNSLAAGDGYHCGIVGGGAAYCWGPNKNGRLGNGSSADDLVPTAVIGSHAFVQLSAAQDHTCGVTTDGNAYCWGGNDMGELGTRSQVPSSTPVRVRLFAP